MSQNIKSILRNLGKIAIVVFLALVYFEVGLYANEVDPHITEISTGPFSKSRNIERARFRCVVIIQEVSLSVFVEKIEYGEENCCLKVVKSYQIAPNKLEGEYKLYRISNINWLSYDSFSFTGNSTNYTIKKLDGDYVVIKY